MVSFKQFTYIQKCMYVFIMRGIIATTKDAFLSADDGGVSGVQAVAKQSGDFLFWESPCI
jgi:hypothetical protein